MNCSSGGLVGGEALPHGSSSNLQWPGEKGRLDGNTSMKNPVEIGAGFFIALVILER
jgi:hypothetical protein